MPPTAQLSVEVTGQHVVARLTIADPPSDPALYIEKSKFPSAPPLRSKLFRIQCQGEEVRYIGPMAKRKAPTREDFFQIPPGGEMKAVADITDLYAFLPGAHDYTIEYRTFHGNPDDESQLNEIHSNPASFHLVK